MRSRLCVQIYHPTLLLHFPMTYFIIRNLEFTQFESMQDYNRSLIGLSFKGNLLLVEVVVLRSVLDTRRLGTQFLHYWQRQ